MDQSQENEEKENGFAQANSVYIAVITALQARMKAMAGAIVPLKRDSLIEQQLPSQA